MKSTDKPIIVVAVVTATVPEVWAAITQIDEMKKWYFDQIPAFKAELGFETQFAVHVEDRTYTHLWKVTEVVPNHKITYRWQYTEHLGTAFVTFELSARDDETHVKLINEVTEDFPTGIPEFTRDSCTAGWKYFIQDRLYHHFGN